MYAIRFDPADNILYLRLEGFWTAATLARFSAEMLVRVTTLKLRRRRWATLSDSSAFPVQSPLVSEALGRMSRRSAEFDAGPTAIIVSSMLNKMQAERTMTGRVRVFLDAKEARAWLIAEHPSPAG